MKILIAEDDTTSRLVLAATLKKMGHEVAAAHNGEQAWAILQNEEFSLIISDWMMPEVDGLELCRRIREQRKMSYTYIILLTALGGKTNYLEAMDAGADDFITKPFDAEQLAARLRVALRILELHETLRTHAMHDSLTGLYNRVTILNSLAQELDRAPRESKPTSVILSDIDHFKRVNDTYGHPAGDAVLRKVAQCMRSSLRSYDKVGRYGGEEFLMVLPGCAQSDAVAVGNRIRLAIEAAQVHTKETTIAVTISMGVIVSGSGGSARMENLIQNADTALYRAKSAGRNRVEMAEEQLRYSDLT